MPIDGYIDVVFATDGDKTEVPDAADPGGLVSYDQGYPAGYEIPPGDPGSLPIERAKFNYLLNIAYAAIQQYQQHGTPPFITSVMNGGSPYLYNKYDRVLLDGVVYTSIENSNTDTPPSSKWNSNLPVSTLGDISFSFNATPGYGKLLLDGTSIGSSGSGASHIGSTYFNLYAFLWNNCSFPSTNTVAPVTGGLGANAAADFAANKKLTMPTGANYSLMGIGSIVSLSGGTAGSATVSATGSVGGGITINSFTPSLSQLTPHAHDVQVYGGPDGGSGTTINIIQNKSSPGTATGAALSVGGGASITPTGSLSATFTGTGSSVVHPVLGCYVFINYL